MKTIGNLIIIFLPISLVGIIFKMLLFAGGGPIITFSLGISIILLLLQYILILRTFKNYPTLKTISSLMSLALSIIFMAILFRYQWWSGAMFLYLISDFLFVIFSIVFIVNYKKMINNEYKKLVIKNIIFPWIFAFIIGIIPVIMSFKTFYETFNVNRQNITFEKYIEQHRSIN